MRIKDRSAVHPISDEIQNSHTASSQLSPQVVYGCTMISGTVCVAWAELGHQALARTHRKAELSIVGLLRGKRDKRNHRWDHDLEERKER